MHKVFQFLSVFCITTLIALGFPIHSYANPKIPSCNLGDACEPIYVKCSRIGGDSGISGQTEDSACPTNNSQCTNWCNKFPIEKEERQADYSTNNECRCMFGSDDALNKTFKYIDSRINIWFDSTENLLLKSYELDQNENILNSLCQDYKDSAENAALECDIYNECEGYDNAAICDENGIIQCKKDYLLSSDKKEGCIQCPNGAICDGTKNITGCTPDFYKTSNTLCKTCPFNATCTGGTEGFKCDKNYYKNNTSCNKCPDNSTSSQGSTKINDCKCNKDTYMDNKSCVSCPPLEKVWTDEGHNTKAQTGTTEIGKTNKSDCSLPAGTYYDEKGTFTIDENQTCPINKL